MALCVLWAMAWGLRAIWLDNRVTANDSLFPHALSLFELWAHPRTDAYAYWEWLNAIPTHPPLAPLFTALFAAVAGPSHEVAQISTLTLFGLLVVEVYRLARTCAVRWPGPLLAAVITATSPILAAWFRVTYPETMMALLVTSTLRQAMATDLRRTGPAVMLGVLTGLGALTKLGFWVVMLVPALFFLGSRVRDRITLLNGLAAVASVAAVCGWWYFGHLPGIWENLTASSGSPVGLYPRAMMYIVAPQGNLALTVLALVGVAMILGAGAVSGWWTRAMLLLAWIPGYVGFIAVFDFWERYIVPVLPLSCLLAAVGTGGLVVMLPRRAHRAAVAGVVVALAATFAYQNLRAPARTLGLLDMHGMVQPDARDLSALPRALARIQRKRYPTVMLTAAPAARRWLNGHMDRARAHGDPRALTVKEARALLGRGRPVYFLHIEGPVTMADAAWSPQQNNVKVALYLAWRRQVVARYWDESPFSVVLYKLLPR